MFVPLPSNREHTVRDPQANFILIMLGWTRLVAQQRHRVSAAGPCVCVCVCVCVCGCVRVGLSIYVRMHVVARLRLAIMCVFISVSVCTDFMRSFIYVETCVCT